MLLHTCLDGLELLMDRKCFYAWKPGTLKPDEYDTYDSAIEVPEGVYELTNCENEFYINQPQLVKIIKQNS